MFLWRFVSIWTVILLIDSSAFGLSGIYNDNGIGQTVKKKSIPRADVQLIRNHILEMVGLPQRPHKTHHKRFRLILIFCFNFFKEMVLV